MEVCLVFCFFSLDENGWAHSSFYKKLLQSAFQYVRDCENLNFYSFNHGNL
uniref:Uncharacterized protein n=1 Tax=Rhizophora mucronata TaxID=61149 RepID=A0A2P2NPJ9_RHIMU